MSESLFFKIADHVLKIDIPLDFEVMHYLPSFRDFEIDSTDVLSSLIEVVISYDPIPVSKENTKLLADNSITWGEGFSFEESPENYITTMKSLDSLSKIVMFSSKDFKKSIIYLTEAEASQSSMLSWFLMVTFAQGVLPYQTVMIHASTVERNGDEAYAFLGKSGTGKSTHSQLWLKYLDGFTLLNDDNPAIRIVEDGTVFIYGTPWSGKTECYRNLKVRLKGFVRLRQAQLNFFERKKGTDSLVLLLPSCTAIRWNKQLFSNMVDTVESIIAVVPVGVMDCLINQEAANVSFNGIKFNL